MTQRRSTWWPRVYGVCVAAVLALVGTRATIAGPDAGGNKPGEKPVTTQKPASPGAPPALVRLGVVRREKLQARTNVVGRIQEVRRAIVSAERPGRVINVAVEAGDPVTAGQTVLAQIDEVLQKIDLAHATAQLAEARAGAEEADALLQLRQRHHTYLKQLESRGSAQPKEVRDAGDAEISARASVKRNQAAIRAAAFRVQLREEWIKRLRVVAPFDGYVVRKIAEVGQWVDEGDPVAEVISGGMVDVVIHVPERFIDRIKTGDEVEIKIEPLEINVPGKVKNIVPLADNPARTFPVTIRLDDQRGRLKSGMSAIGYIPMTHLAEHFTVPRDAVHRNPEGVIVWAAVDGRALPVSVRILFGFKDRYAVEPVGGAGTPPLAPQMHVVIEGAERLFPGRPLSVPTMSTATTVNQ